MALYPVKFVDWREVVEWTAELSEKVVGDGFRPDVVVAIGRGGFVVARLLCDFLDVSNLLCVPVKWVEQDPRPGEKYTADLVRGWVEASKRGSSYEEAVARVVSKLKCVLSFDYHVDLKGMRSPAGRGDSRHRLPHGAGEARRPRELGVLGRQGRHAGVEVHGV